MRDVYMDYNATTPTRREARVLAERVLCDCYGNPSSVHFAGRQAKKILDESREKLAAALGARVSEIVFTLSTSSRLQKITNCPAFSTAE